MVSSDSGKKDTANKTLRERIYNIVYHSDSWAGWLFDVILLTLIATSVIVVLIDSIPTYSNEYGDIFNALEWIFTVLFSIEYILRIYIHKKPLQYVFSFMGIIDLLAILPTLLSFVLVGSGYLIIMRAVRLLRIFRIFKLAGYLTEINFLLSAIYHSYRKISVFMLFVIVMVIILGSFMHLIEGGENGFDTIPNSIYWAVVTLTTVGYGDISPVTPLGRFFAVTIMLCGYGIIAVPTGIVTNELVLAAQRRRSSEINRSCNNCFAEGHDSDALYCKYCGTAIEEE
jgi:voltage-gated potassium channel